MRFPLLLPASTGFLLLSSAPCAQITELVDATGGGVAPLIEPGSLAVDADGTVYVSGRVSDNVLALGPASGVQLVIDASGDGTSPLSSPGTLALEPSGSLVVVGGASDNAFRIDAVGVAEIIDAATDGKGGTFNGPRSLAIGAGDAVVVSASTGVFRIEQDGSVVKIAPPVTFSSQGDTATDVFGNVFVADHRDDLVVRIDAQCQVDVIIDATGDGLGNVLEEPWGLAVDAAGNAYVAGRASDNVFRVTPAGVVTEIADASGDGLGNPLSAPRDVAVDVLGNVFVCCQGSNNAFRITPLGVIEEIIDATGDGLGNTFSSPNLIAADGAGHAFVAGAGSNNVFRIDSMGSITEVLDATGDGMGHPLDRPDGMAVDAAGCLYVSNPSYSSAGGLFRIDPAGTITLQSEFRGHQLAFDSQGELYAIVSFRDVVHVAPDGSTTPLITFAGTGTDHVLDAAQGVACDAGGTVYVSSLATHNVFRVHPDGSIDRALDAALHGSNGPGSLLTNASGDLFVAGRSSDNVLRLDAADGTVELVVDANGNGSGHALRCPRGMALDADGNLYVAGFHSDNVLRVTPEGEVSEIIDASGAGPGRRLYGPEELAVDTLGNVYVTGFYSNNAFRIAPHGAIFELIDAGGDGQGNPLLGPSGIAVDDEGKVFVSGAASDNVFMLPAPTAYLLLGSSPAPGAFTDGTHSWSTLVSGVSKSFELGAGARSFRVPAPDPPGSHATIPSNRIGTLYAQVVSLGRDGATHWSHGLELGVWSNGRVSMRAYGTANQAGIESLRFRDTDGFPRLAFFESMP